VHYALNTKLMSLPCLCFNKKIQIGLKFELRVVCAIVVLEYICDFVTLNLCVILSLWNLCVILSFFVLIHECLQN